MTKSFTDKIMVEDEPSKRKNDFVGHNFVDLFGCGFLRRSLSYGGQVAALSSSVVKNLPTPVEAGMMDGCE